MANCEMEKTQTPTYAYGVMNNEFQRANQIRIMKNNKVVVVNWMRFAYSRLKDATAPAAVFCFPG